jgi:hypothetical protein
MVSDLSRLNTSSLRVAHDLLIFSRNIYDD